MKKKGKYYYVNNQEDEDGYSHYPCNTKIYKNAKKKLGTSSRGNTTDSEKGSAKPLLGRIALSLCEAE